jgi:hypothetical protein
MSLLKKLIVMFLLIPVVPLSAGAEEAWYEEARRRFSETWKEGQVEAYVPFLSWHMPFAYTSEQISSYNQSPKGFGLGKGRYNSSGNYEGMYAMVFQDSHGQPEYMIGYAWIPTWPIRDTELKVGVGLVGFITARADIAHYTPFPGILPVASLSIASFSVQAAYVPGGSGNGNVLFAWTKWTFD